MPDKPASEGVQETLKASGSAEQRPPTIYERYAGLPLPPRGEVGLWNYSLLIMDRYTLPTLLGLAVALLVLFVPEIALFAVVVLAMLSPMVLIHEWGHYIVARRGGLAVEEFSIGMGRRIWSRVSPKTGVRWSLKALPVGGSVSVQGMTVEQVEETGVPRDRAYVYAPIWTRLRLSLAGVFMNLVAALLTLYIVVVVMAVPEHGLWNALWAGPLAALYVLWMLFSHTISAVVTAIASLGFGGEASSIIGMPSTVQDGLQEATASGMNPLMYYAMIFVAMNLSLACVNLLPLYMLDGHHAMIAAADGVRKVAGRKRRRREGSDFAPLRSARFGIYNKASGAVLVVFIGVVLVRDATSLLGG